jgi:hypothetical protein
MIELTLPYPISATFGLLTVISRAENDRFGRTQWHCRCACGTERIVALFRMKSGHTKSCGCIKGKARATHRAKGTATHNTWCAMKQRCSDPHHPQFEHYGARGIKVCERWATSFTNFLADMGERPPGLSIERNNNDGDYEPGNCRWATNSEQSRNRRSNINVERNGVTKCVKDWCEELGIPVDRVYGRVRRGETPSEALR